MMRSAGAFPNTTPQGAPSWGQSAAKSVNLRRNTGTISRRGSWALREAVPPAPKIGTPMDISRSASRICTTFALSLCLVARLSAATPEAAPSFEWAASAGGLKNDKTRAINIDREGNVFLAGEVTDEVKFGDTTLKSVGGMDFFVAKLDPKGKFLWARLGGGSLIDRGYGVATDAAGNCYVTGHYQSTDANFGGFILPNRGEYDIFTAKYDRHGKLLWVRAAPFVEATGQGCPGQRSVEEPVVGSL